MHAHRVASRIAVPAAFPRAAILKVANHPLLPQFSSGLNRTSSSQVRRKVNTPELFRSRGNVVRLNEKTTNYGRVHRAPPATSPPDSMSLPEFFPPDISVRCARHPLCLSAWHTCSGWHYVHIHTHTHTYSFTHWYSYLCALRNAITSSKFRYHGNFCNSVRWGIWRYILHVLYEGNETNSELITLFRIISYLMPRRINPQINRSSSRGTNSPLCNIENERRNAGRGKQLIYHSARSSKAGKEINMFNNGWGFAGITRIKIIPFSCSARNLTVPVLSSWNSCTSGQP